MESTHLVMICYWLISALGHRRLEMCVVDKIVFSDEEAYVSSFIRNLKACSKKAPAIHRESELLCVSNRSFQDGQWYSFNDQQVDRVSNLILIHKGLQPGLLSLSYM
jgi:hypothetical protein